MKARNGHVSTTPAGARVDAAGPVADESAAVPEPLPDRRLRELAQIREVLHSSPEEVILHVAYAQRHEVKGELLSTTYGLRAADGSELTAVFVPPEQPLFLELDESRALGLRRPGHPAQVVVLRDDLAPLVADEAEAERARLRYRRGRPGERR